MEVKKDWMQPTGAVGLLNFQLKLSRLKKTLKIWNKEVFGIHHNNLIEAEAGVVAAQDTFELNPNVNKLITQYILLLKMEEDLWRQKAAIRWLKYGDANTKFNQSWVKQKRARLHIHSIHVGSRHITDEAEIKTSAASFFQELQAPPDMDLAEPNLDLLPRLTSSSSLDGLVVQPSAEEVKRAVWDISADSTPGPGWLYDSVLPRLLGPHRA